MMENWQRAAEAVAHRIAITNAGAVGFLSIDGNAGVSTFSRVLCDVLSMSGSEPLLVELATPSEGAEAIGDVSPDGMFIQDRRKDGEEGRSRIVARHAKDTRFLFNNVTVLRQTWKEELRSYANLILDLPPLFHKRQNLLSPLAAAASCNEVFLVCLQGSTAGWRLADAVTFLRTSGVNLTGIVVNARDYSSVAEEIGLVVRRFLFFAPGIALGIDKKLRASPFLG